MFFSKDAKQRKAKSKLRYRIKVDEDPSTGRFTARIDALNVSGTGDTRKEALKGVQKELEKAVKERGNKGKALPKSDKLPDPNFEKKKKKRKAASKKKKSSKKK